MKLTFEDLQAYLLHIYGNYDSRTAEQSLFMKLVEELGEVAEVLNKRVGRKASDAGDLDAQLASELVDMVHYIAAIAALNGIDLGESILSKDKKAAIKYHHDTNLEEFIREKNA